MFLKKHWTFLKNIGRFQKNNGMFFSIHFILFLVAKNALLTVGFIRNKYIYPHVKNRRRVITVF